MPWVLATREGLVGRKTSTGWNISNDVPFVALPSHAALHLWVKVTNPRVTDDGVPRSCYALVLDTGPWYEDDDAYVFGNARPRSESGLMPDGRKTNKAGIDLGEQVYQRLGMQGNGDVNWEFVPDAIRVFRAPTR